MPKSEVAMFPRVPMYQIERFIPSQCPRCYKSFIDSKRFSVVKDWSTADGTIIECSFCENRTLKVTLEIRTVPEEEAIELCSSGNFTSLSPVKIEEPSVPAVATLPWTTAFDEREGGTGDFRLHVTSEANRPIAAVLEPR